VAAVANPTGDTLEKPWIQGLSAVLDLTDRRNNPRLRTTMSCTLKKNRIAFFLPPEMSSLQPENLRYMHRIAKKHDCRLIEDRRTVNVQPIIEQRNHEASTMTLGISALLKQACLPGTAPTPSVPHRLNRDNLHIDVADLISMAAFATPTSKKIVLLPNQFMVEVLDNETSPIAGYACKLVTADAVTTLTYFDSEFFKCVGYRAGNQFVMHVFLAGGPLHSPQVWANPHTISHDDFRFQLFKSTHSGHDFGLMYKTFYFDIDENATSASSNDTPGTSTPKDSIGKTAANASHKAPATPKNNIASKATAKEDVANPAFKTLYELAGKSSSAKGKTGREGGSKKASKSKGK